MSSLSSSRSPILKAVPWLALLAGLASAGAYGVRYYRTKQDIRPSYETARVDRGRITARVTATGTVSALVTVQVGSQVSGRIATLAADFNSHVKKGQVIATIDPELFKAALAQAQANYTAAQGNLARVKAQAEDATRQAERAKQLADRNLIAIADRDTAVFTAAAAVALVEATSGSVAQAQAALHSAQVNLNYTTIVSPIDGQVISRSVDVGQTVAASLQAPTLFTIAEDLRKMQVDTNVSEADVGKLQPGMPASFTVDAFPGQRFLGRVRQIRNAPQTIQNVVTYDAVVDVDNAELKLKPGMTANVTFTYEDKQDVLRVPNIALRFRPPSELLPSASGSASGGSAALPPTAGRWTAPGGVRRRDENGEPARDQRTLWILRGTTPTPRTLRVGVSDGTLSEVLEGELKPGDRVLTGLAGDATQSTRPARGGLSQQPHRRIF